MSRPVAGASGAMPAIARAAVAVGLPDPIRLGDELLLVDVDALEEWFAVADGVRGRLRQGIERLAQAGPVLAAGWSAPAPRLAVEDQRAAGQAGADAVARHVAAADRATATLRQTRQLADRELSAAEAALLRLGWIPSEELIGWATDNNALIPLMAILTNLCQQLRDLGTRNDDALHEFALALRADPRDQVQSLIRTAGTGSTTPPVAATPGPAGALQPAATPSGSAAIDRENLDLLDADLRSTDVATLAMAMGVAAALQKARTGGAVAQLLVYESATATGQGRAAISVGDITTADNVAVLAPGISNAPVNMAEGIASVTAIRDEAGRQAPGDETAVIAWYGYDIPLSAIGGVPVTPLTALTNTAAALDDRSARAGGSLLARDMQQFREWTLDGTRFVGIGFSMGSTTVSAAAARGAGFDDLLLLGSPGASNDVRTANDYPQLPAGHVHVLSMDQDPITLGRTDLLAGVVGSIGRIPVTASPFGPDPAGAGFGAAVIDVPSNRPDLSIDLSAGGWAAGPLSEAVSSAVANTMTDLVSHHQEGNYLSGAALQAVGDVVVGQYGDVPTKPGR